jgi:hypothetical protein
MLSVVAFVLEVSPLGQPQYSSQVAFTGRIGERNEVPIHEGDLVVVPDKHKNPREQRDATRPDGRGIEKHTLIESIQPLPANHTCHDESKMWRHPGFFKDEPAPTANPKKTGIRLGLSPSRGSRPRRRNI